LEESSVDTRAVTFLQIATELGRRNKGLFLFGHEAFCVLKGGVNLIIREGRQLILGLKKRFGDLLNILEAQTLRVSDIMNWLEVLSEAIGDEMNPIDIGIPEVLLHDSRDARN